MAKRKAAIPTTSRTVGAGCGTEFLVDADDYEKVSNRSWHISDEGYVRGNISLGGGQYKAIQLHRYILSPPKSKLVDHVNGNKLDNRKSNLRLATQTENLRNSGPRITNSSGYKGVSYRRDTGKWRAQITVHGKRTNLGQFDCKHDAARMFNFWAAELHGEFAWLNKIEEGVDE